MNYTTAAMGATIFSVQKEAKGGIVNIYSKGGNTYEQDTRRTQTKDFRSHCSGSDIGEMLEHYDEVLEPEDPMSLPAALRVIPRCLRRGGSLPTMRSNCRNGGNKNDKRAGD
jgi:hypothetical protein